MLANPSVGQRVRIHYAARYSPMMTLHGRCGVVRIVSKGKPRNHGIEIDGILYGVPCGNLMKESER